MKNLLFGLALFISFAILGCNKNELSIYKPQTAPIVTGFDFELILEGTTSIIAKYGSVDLHFRIVPQGQEPSTQYTVSHIQYMGTGILQDMEDNFLGQNIGYHLNDRNFTLRYTSYSDTEHFFEVSVKDNFGHVKKKKVKFMPQNEVAMGK
ncbi:TraQ conjugal transfer family protein [Pedobacter sp.]|uniref:TraQ conjugal transfer family protein n=1 Tax=Pedobacter sp. TaxID=1411316 RepID=UPI00396CAC94